MICVRFRQLDWQDWTFVTFDGEEEDPAAQVLCGWLLAQELEAERFEGEDDWIPLGEET